MTQPGHYRALLLHVPAVLALAGLSLPPQPLRAQQETQFSTDVNVVNIYATVRDKQMKIVKSLAADDFCSHRRRASPND